MGFEVPYLSYALPVGITSLALVTATQTTGSSLQVGERQEVHLGAWALPLGSNVSTVILLGGR